MPMPLFYLAGRFYFFIHLFFVSLFSQCLLFRNIFDFISSHVYNFEFSGNLFRFTDENHLNKLLDNATMYELNEHFGCTCWICVMISILGANHTLSYKFSLFTLTHEKQFWMVWLVPCAVLLIFITEFRESRCSKKVIAHKHTK